MCEMCVTAARLRYELYRTAERLEAECPMGIDLRAAIERNRERPEYQAALKALREHLASCEECKQCH